MAFGQAMGELMPEISESLQGALTGGAA